MDSAERASESSGNRKRDIQSLHFLTNSFHFLLERQASCWGRGYVCSCIYEGYCQWRPGKILWNSITFLEIENNQSEKCCEKSEVSFTIPVQWNHPMTFFSMFVPLVAGWKWSGSSGVNCSQTRETESWVDRSRVWVKSFATGGGHFRRLKSNEPQILMRLMMASVEKAENTLDERGWQQVSTPEILKLEDCGKNKTKCMFKWYGCGGSLRNVMPCCQNNGHTCWSYGRRWQG